MAIFKKNKKNQGTKKVSLENFNKRLEVEQMGKDNLDELMNEPEQSESNVFDTRSEIGEKKIASESLNIQDGIKDEANAEKTKSKEDGEEKEETKKKDKFDSSFEAIQTPNLSPVESYDLYDIAKNKVVNNYKRIIDLNSYLSLDALAVQVHLYLFDQKYFDIDELIPTFKEFIKIVFDRLHTGKAVVLTRDIIIDTVEYNRNVLPIVIASSKLLLQSQLLGWSAIIPNKTKERMLILESFLLMIDNALNSGFEVKISDEVMLVRGTSRKTKAIGTAIVASEKFLEAFNAKAQLEERRAQSEADRFVGQEKISKETLSRIHHILDIEAEDMTLDEDQYQKMKISEEKRIEEEREHQIKAQRDRQREAQEKAKEEDQKAAEVKEEVPVEVEEKPISVKSNNAPKRKSNTVIKVKIKQTAKKATPIKKRVANKKPNTNTKTGGTPHMKPLPTGDFSKPITKKGKK